MSRLIRTHIISLRCFVLYFHNFEFLIIAQPGEGMDDVDVHVPAAADGVEGGGGNNGLGGEALMAVVLTPTSSCSSSNFYNSSSYCNTAIATTQATGSSR